MNRWIMITNPSSPCKTYVQYDFREHLRAKSIFTTIYRNQDSDNYTVTPYTSWYSIHDKRKDIWYHLDSDRGTTTSQSKLICCTMVVYLPLPSWTKILAESRMKGCWHDSENSIHWYSEANWINVGRKKKHPPSHHHKKVLWLPFPVDAWFVYCCFTHIFVCLLVRNLCLRSLGYKLWNDQLQSDLRVDGSRHIITIQKKWMVE